MTARQEFLDLYDEARVNDQINWYKGRAEEYHSATKQAFLITQVLLLAAAICGLIGALDVARETLGLIAAILALVATLVAGWSALIGFSDNAERYSAAAKQLRKVRLDREAAAASDEAMAAYMASAEQVMLGEVSSWEQQWTKLAKPSDAPAAGGGEGGG